MTTLLATLLSLALLAAIVLFASQDPRVPRLLPVRRPADAVPTARHRRQDAQTGMIDATELRRRLDAGSLPLELPRVPSRRRTLDR